MLIFLKSGYSQMMFSCVAKELMPTPYKFTESKQMGQWGRTSCVDHTFPWSLLKNKRLNSVIMLMNNIPYLYEDESYLLARGLQVHFLHPSRNLTQLFLYISFNIPLNDFHKKDLLYTSKTFSLQHDLYVTPLYIYIF